jgi:hypothetical protein
MKNIILEKIGLDNLKNRLLQGDSISKISRDTNIPDSTLSAYLIKNNIFTKKSNPYNKDFFKKIDTELKAYILGYIIADGCITIEKRKDRPSTINRVQFQSAITDLQILTLIRDSIAPKNKITLTKTKDKKRQDTIKLRLANREIVNDLITLYDILPRKTYHNTFKMPVINKKLQHHFIRGFFDGDGSVGKKHFSFVFNSKPFLYDVLNIFLEKIPDLKYYIYDEYRNKTLYFSLHFSFNYNIKSKLFNFLYKDANYKLDKKFNIFYNTVLNSRGKKLLSV